MDLIKYISMFSQRLSQLRIEANVSARDMSLSLGLSESYINKIENKKALPSMESFLNICEFLDIEPKDFFDFTMESPKLSQELLIELQHLSYAEKQHLLLLLQDINALRNNQKPR